MLTLLPLLLFAAALAMIALCFARKVKFVTALYSSAGLTVAAFFGTAAIIDAVSGGNIIQELIDAAMDDMRLMAASLAESGGQFGDVFSAAGISVTLDMMRETYILLFPALVIIITLLFFYLLYMFAKTIMRIAKKDVSFIPPYYMTRFSKTAAIALGTAFIGSLLVEHRGAAAALVNISVILSGAAAFCGLALIEFHLRRRIRGGIMRVLLYFAVFIVFSWLQTIMYYALTMTAAADAFLDFRSKTDKRNKDLL